MPINVFKMKMEQAALEEMSTILRSSDTSSARKAEQLVLLSSLLAVDTPARAASVLQVISLPVLFGCLHTEDSGQVKACCSVLKKLINTVDAGVVLGDTPLLVSGFQHKSSEVRLLCISAANKSLNSEVACLEVLESDLGVTMVRLLADEDLLCSQAASDFLSTAIGYDACSQLLFQVEGQLLKELIALLGTSSTVRYRVFAMIASLATKSEAMLSLCGNAGILVALFDDLATDDILVCLNAIEVLDTLVASAHTVAFLCDQGVVRQLATVVTTAESNPVNQFILPGVFKFYGLLCDSGHVDVCDLHRMYPEFLDSTLLLLAARDSMLFLTLMDTVALVCRSRGGMHLVLEHKSCGRAFDTLCHALTTGPSDARERALVAMRVVLGTAVSVGAGHGGASVACIESKWYSPIASSASVSPAQSVWSYGKDPSVRVRCAALNLLSVFIKLPFGIRDVLSLPGFLEYLLDRATEIERSGWEAKYTLIKEILASAAFTDRLDAADVMQLRTYVRQGAVFAKGQVSAAVDEDYI